ncbi:Uncharacterised protein [Escherichia coli]|uniref:Uncharacterized protein n=1 Tax=Escherichia coli TaxID=562 RepID=A0A376WU46_ECOLX|nr:Uncharacterised protein [Escherichia coli]
MENQLTNLITVHEHIVEIIVIRPVHAHALQVILCQQIGMSAFIRSRQPGSAVLVAVGKNNQVLTPAGTRNFFMKFAVIVAQVFTL